MSLKIDELSYKVGMINCFVEVVACGVKRLAISSPLTPPEYERIKDASDKIVEGFQIKSYLEKSIIVTALAPEEFTKGTWSILYFKTDDVLDSYLELKKRKENLEAQGRYDKSAYEAISREFMKLLSYSDAVIEEKIAKKEPESPYLLISDQQ